jgi:hypothetical protein
MKSIFTLRGFVIAELYGADGQLKWRDAGENLIVDQGIEFIMDTALSAGTQDSTYFIGLKDTGTVAAGDTAASHAGWSEITAIYTGNRPAWTEAGVSSKVITNSASPASFSITGTDDVYGAFLATDNTGTAGSLIGAKDFAAAVSVINGDTLNITYQITGSSS